MSAHKGWYDKALFLLGLGAKVNVDFHGYSNFPIIAACKGGHSDMVELLLDHNADTRRTVEAASEKGHLAIVKLLLNRGIGPTGGLNKATAGGHRDIAVFLLDHGSDVKEIKSESLASLVALEHTALLRLLHGRGAFMGGEIGAACMERARELGLESMIQLLRGSEVDGDSGQTTG